MARGLHRWPPERARRLVELWPDLTKSIPAIARELGVSKEAVIRRADYLALRGRPIRSLLPSVTNEGRSLVTRNEGLSQGKVNRDGAYSMNGSG